MGAWTSPLGDLPPSPDGPLTTQVTCRAGTRGRSAKHDITLAADWSLTTPHDLDAERILAALGGTLSCINLNDVVVPALHELVQLSARRRLAGVRRTDRSRWILTRRTCTRCHDHAFRTPADAARHERTLDHWVGATRDLDSTRCSTRAAVSPTCGTPAYPSSSSSTSTPTSGPTAQRADAARQPKEQASA